MKKWLFILTIFLLTSACEKVEGEGGNSTITGKVFARDFDNDGDFKAEYYLPEKQVYIIYGDDDFYNDAVKTHFDGSFRFQYLHPGSYQIFTYSKCRNCDEPLTAVFVDVEITEKDQTVDVGDIIIEE